MSGPDVELEERLRALAPAFKDGIEPPATLHINVMASTIAPRSPVRRPSMLRELSLAAAVVVFVALLAFGFSKLHSLTPAPVKPSPHPTATAIPWIPAPMVLSSSSVQQGTPAEVAKWIRHAVTAVDPLLIPEAIGEDYTAQFVADPHSFVVDYSSNLRHATVELSAMGVMPNQGATARPTMRTFRGVAATYQVEGATATAPRSLYWTENSPSHAPYSLLTAGLNETEFWQIANSLHMLSGAAQLRPCLASDLRAAIGKGSAATGGQLYNSIVFSNHSSTDCRLDGTPHLQLVTASGGALALPQTDMSAPWDPGAPGIAVMDGGAAAPAPTAGGLGPSGQASVIFIMYDCPGPEPALSRIVVALPNGRGNISVPAGSDVAFSRGAACDANGSVHSIGVSPVAGLMPQPKWVENSALSVMLSLPDHVRAGQTLHYLVILTNASGAPFHFHGECPGYSQDASRAGRKNVANHELNCSGVGWLGPNESVTFAMQLDIPADAPPGPGNLRWTMHYAYGGGQASGSFTITAP
jgi:hypothetical protein